MEEYRFKVNLGGMIEILSDHLYSSPDVYIRELLQNGVDAIVGREKRDPEYEEMKKGVLNISLQEGNCLAFVDNGVGLTKDEIHKFLAVIGQSSKRDLQNGTIFSDYIGRFGIGLLSCFMVADQIRIRTRSVDSEEGYEWIGKPDGTYVISKQNVITEGTEIYLEAKTGCEEYFTAQKVESLILHYGLILPYPVLLDDGESKRRINPVKLPWEQGNCDKAQLLMFGQIIFGQRFMDCALLRSEKGGITGVAYILPYTVQPSSRQNHLIYLKNMLLTEKGQNILPDWAVFTKCIINARDLRPTASRESFYEDEALEQAKEEIGECIAKHIKQMARMDKKNYEKFLDIHSLVVKSMAIEDDELFQLFIDDLEFTTTRGIMTGCELRLSKEVLLHCSMEEYRQLSQIFTAQGKLLINAGYVFVEPLLYKMQEFFSVKVEHVAADEVDDLLKDISLVEAEQAVDFVKVANRVLGPYHCVVEMKKFIPANLPAFYYMDANAKLYHEIERVQNEADSLFTDMLANFAGEIKGQAEAILYFNMQNPIIRKLVKTSDERQIEDVVLILYVQTLLIGGFSLRNNELGIMNDKILSLMEKTLVEE